MKFLALFFPEISFLFAADFWCVGERTSGGSCRNGGEKFREMRENRLLWLFAPKSGGSEKKPEREGRRVKTVLRFAKLGQSPYIVLLGLERTRPRIFFRSCGFVWSRVVLFSQ